MNKKSPSPTFFHLLYLNKYTEIKIQLFSLESFECGHNIVMKPPVNVSHSFRLDYIITYYVKLSLPWQMVTLPSVFL